MVKKLLIAGGPGGGKSTTLRNIEEEFRGKVLCVPEAATLLLKGGFPPPGEVPDPIHLMAFQRTIFTTIVELERVYMRFAERDGIKLVLCDRGRLDGEAYVSEGRVFFERLVGIKDRAAELASYDEVIYLESPALASDVAWNATSGNEHRMENDREIAKRIEYGTWSAWCDHPNITRLTHDLGYHGKYEYVRGRVLELLG